MYYYPKRYVPVFWGFLSQIIFVGYESIVSIVMVHILRSDDRTKDKDPKFLVFECTVNVSVKVSEDWTVSSTQYIHSAYLTGLLSTQLLGGYLATRYSPKRVCGISILLSSILLLVIPTAIKVHFVLVLIIRIVQGCIEGSSKTALNGVISAWAPKSESSRMFSFINSGSYLSPAVAFCIAGITGCIVSWNASLYIYGGCGILWSCIWFSVVLDTPSQHPGLSRYEKLLFEREGPGVQPGSNKIAKRIPWRNIISSMPMWAVTVGSFSRNWMFSLMMMGIPQYFEVAFTKNIAEIGLEVALPPLFMATVTVLGGFMIDGLIKNQLVSRTAGRKIAQCVGFGVEGCCIVSLRFIDRQEIALIVICFGAAFSGLSASGYQVNAHDLAPQYVSILTGIFRVGVIGGVLSTLISGALVPKNIKAWQNIFTISGSIPIAGAVFYGIFASGERQKWSMDSEKNVLINCKSQDQEETRLMAESENTAVAEYDTFN